jgi:hypothetical protein
MNEPTQPATFCLRENLNGVDDDGLPEHSLGSIG